MKKMKNKGRRRKKEKRESAVRPEGGRNNPSHLDKKEV